MDKLLREIKYAVRSLRKDKGYASAVVLTLAVCIGANTATFAIVHSVLLRPLPVPEADGILLTSNSYPKAGAPDMGNSSAGDYYDRLREVPAFAEQAMFDYASGSEHLNSVLAVSSRERLNAKGSEHLREARPLIFFSRIQMGVSALPPTFRLGNSAK